LGEGAQQQLQPAATEAVAGAREEEVVMAGLSRKQRMLLKMGLAPSQAALPMLQVAA
jgi:hypothetical protein